MTTCPTCGHSIDPPEPIEPEPMSRADLKSMTPAAIEEARRAGRLDHLLGTTTTKGTNQ